MPWLSQWATMFSKPPHQISRWILFSAENDGSCRAMALTTFIQANWNSSLSITATSSRCSRVSRKACSYHP